MYIHRLYPTHMWYKNLESIIAASGSLALLAFLRQNVLQIKTVWRHPWSKGSRASQCCHWLALEPLLCLFDDSGAQQPKQRARKPQVLPMQCFWGRSHPWFARQRCNRDGFFRHPESTRNSRRLETHLGGRVQSEDGDSICSGVRGDHESLPASEYCQGVSAYEVPFPAFTMELLGKTLDQSTTEEDIDNEGVLVAFNNAAAAVQYLHSFKIAHRDIKPHNFCHQLHCHSWEVKLIDFDAAEELPAPPLHQSQSVLVPMNGSEV